MSRSKQCKIKDTRKSVAFSHIFPSAHRARTSLGASYLMCRGLEASGLIYIGFEAPGLVESVTYEWTNGLVPSNLPFRSSDSFIKNQENIAADPHINHNVPPFSFCFAPVQILMGGIVGLQWIKEIQWSFANERGQLWCSSGVSLGTGLSGPLARVSQSLAPTQGWADPIGRARIFLESYWSTAVPPHVWPPERNFVGKLEWQRRLADNGSDSWPQIFNKYLAKLAQNKSENKSPHSDKSETGEIQMAW